MGQLNFEVEIVEQGWLKGDAHYDVVAYDLCSHGDIRLVIGGEVISAGDRGEQKYGISETALALLRTLEADHSVDAPVAEQLVMHGCGTILMTTCPVGIDWSVSHIGGHVRIANVVRRDTVAAPDEVLFPGLTAEIDEAGYRRQVIAFADRAKELFAGIDKLLEDDFDRREYEGFWREYEGLLQRARG